MSDYIKRKDALKAVIEVCDVLTLVVPSADVAPVRHGRWVTDEEDDGWVWNKCSECGYHMLADHRYCPNCGAIMDMDGDADD